jgi:hypothetical protein
MLNNEWQRTYIKEMTEDYVGQSMTGDKDYPNGIQALVSATGIDEEAVIDIVTELGFDPTNLSETEFEEVLKHVEGMNEGDDIEVPVEEEEEEEEADNSGNEDVDRSLYFVLSLVTQALDGDEDAIKTLQTINSLVDGRVGNSAMASKKIADKTNQRDNEKVGNAPRLRALFKDVYFKLNKASKDEAEKENEE